jgi:tRNA-intron endonuclease
VTVDAGRDASALYSKGNHGTPQSGGALSLTLVEAAYLVESGRLRVEDKEAPVGLAELLALGTAREERFELRYLVYRDFRERGYVIREEPASAKIDFSVRARGTSPKAPSKHWVLALSERSHFVASDICGFAARAEGLGKNPLVAIVDEEGDLTYYEFETGLKAGRGPPKTKATGRGALSGNYVLVSGDAAKALHGEEEMLGKPIKNLLRLSLIEAAYLVEDGRLDLEEAGAGPVGLGGLLEHASLHQHDFALRLAAYRALKHMGLVPKTGFKYGSHFRVYDRDGGSAHARYLVHAVPDNFACSWPELSRAVRLSHGVKKRLVYALASGPQVQFLRVKWTRP